MRASWCVPLLMLGLLAPAAQPDDWNGVVKRYVELFESADPPKPLAYPWLAKRLKTLFGVQDVGHVQVLSEENGKRTLGLDIYYREGEVHIINHGEGWNLVTKGKEAYEWRGGEKDGLITRLTDKDLIDYLIYSTDPFCFMTCFYHEALYEPDKFLPSKEVERGLIEWRFKEPVIGFRAAFVSEQPAWLCGFEHDGPEGGEPVRVIFSKPESLKEVPAGVFERLKGIEFKKSGLSIRRHLEYL